MVTLNYSSNANARAAPAAASAGPDGIKLHIGGCEKREGWVILDPLPGAVVDYVGSCIDLSFLPDASCAGSMLRMCSSNWVMTATPVRWFSATCRSASNVEAGSKRRSHGSLGCRIIT